MIRLLNPSIPTFQMTPTLLFLSQSLTFPNTSTLPWTSIPLQHQAIFPAMIRQIRIVLVKRPPLLKSCAYIQRFRFPTCLSTDTFFHRPPLLRPGHESNSTTLSLLQNISQSVSVPFVRPTRLQFSQPKPTSSCS